MSGQEVGSELETAREKLRQVRALVDKTWTPEDHERLHPALQPASIRVAFLRILEAES